jgi:hypothetical protein
VFDVGAWKAERLLQVPVNRWSTGGTVNSHVPLWSKRPLMAASCRSGVKLATDCCFVLLQFGGHL